MPDNFLEVLDEGEEGEKRYHKSNFRYDEVRDIYICPEGEELKRWAEQRRKGKPPLLLYRGECCKQCAVGGAIHYGGGMVSESRWAGATFGGHEAEAKERGREADLQEAWIHGRTCLRRDKMGWQEAIDGLAWFDESARGVFADVLGAQCEEGSEESARGHSQFAGEVWQLDRRGYAGIQGRTTDFGRGRGVKSALRVNKSSRKGVVVFKG